MPEAYSVVRLTATEPAASPYLSPRAPSTEMVAATPATAPKSTVRIVISPNLPVVNMAAARNPGLNGLPAGILSRRNVAHGADVTFRGMT
jgi:hypothetical protein